MKIVYLLDDFPPQQWTSSGILTLNAAKEMVKKGHQVFVITTDQRKHFSPSTDYEGIRVFRIYADYPVAWRAYVSLYNPQVIKKVKKILDEVKPDVCHFQHLHQYLSYYCLKTARQYTKKVFFTSHDVMPFHYGKFTEFIDKNNLAIEKNFNYHLSAWQLLRYAKKRYNPFRNILIRHYLKSANKIFAVSNELKKALAANKINNCEVVYNGIDIRPYDEIRSEEILAFKNKYGLGNKKVIFFSGRLNYLKGSEMAFYYLQKVKKVIPRATLIIAGGDNSYVLGLKERVKKYGFNGDDVVFTGFLNRQEILVAYKACHLVIVPSICFDSFPTANLEAMAAKKPVMATCFGGSREIVLDGVTGYIINPFNIDLASQKIIEILSDEKLAAKLGEAGYERVKENFSLSQQVFKLLNFYQ